MKTYIVVYNKKEESFDSLEMVKYYLNYIIKDYGEHNTTIYYVDNFIKKELSIEEVINL